MKYKKRVAEYTYNDWFEICENSNYYDFLPPVNVIDNQMCNQILRVYKINIPNSTSLDEKLTTKILKRIDDYLYTLSASDLMRLLNINNDAFYLLPEKLKRTDEVVKFAINKSLNDSNDLYIKYLLERELIPNFIRNNLELVISFIYDKLLEGRSVSLSEENENTLYEALHKSNDLCAILYLNNYYSNNPTLLNMRKTKEFGVSVLSVLKETNINRTGFYDGIFSETKDNWIRNTLDVTNIINDDISLANLFDIKTNTIVFYSNYNLAKQCYETSNKILFDSKYYPPEIDKRIPPLLINNTDSPFENLPQLFYNDTSLISNMIKCYKPMSPYDFNSFFNFLAYRLPIDKQETIALIENHNLPDWFVYEFISDNLLDDKEIKSITEKEHRRFKKEIDLDYYATEVFPS